MCSSQCRLQSLGLGTDFLWQNVYCYFVMCVCLYVCPSVCSHFSQTCVQTRHVTCVCCSDDNAVRRVDDVVFVYSGANGVEWKTTLFCHVRQVAPPRTNDCFVSSVACSDWVKLVAELLVITRWTRSALFTLISHTFYLCTVHIDIIVWKHRYLCTNGNTCVRAFPELSVFKLFIFTVVKNLALNKRTRGHDLP